MKPIFSALKRVRFLSDMPFMDSPAMWTSPSERSSRPERTFNSVVFPDPEVPMMATISPRLTPRSTPRSACTRSPPAAYTFWTPVASIMKSAAVSSTKLPPRSVKTDSRGPSTIFFRVAYTLRSNHMRVAPDSHRTSDRSRLGLRTERLRLKPSRPPWSFKYRPPVATIPEEAERATPHARYATTGAQKYRECRRLGKQVTRRVRRPASEEQPAPPAHRPRRARTGDR